VWGWSSTCRVAFKIDLSTWDTMQGIGAWVGDMSATSNGSGAHTWLGPLTIGNVKMRPTSLVGGERPASGNVGSSRSRKWQWVHASSPGLAQHGHSPGT
jgi:hypothetical protein